MRPEGTFGFATPEEGHTPSPTLLAIKRAAEVAQQALNDPQIQNLGMVLPPVAIGGVLAKAGRLPEILKRYFQKGGTQSELARVLKKRGMMSKYADDIAREEMISHHGDDPLHMDVSHSGFERRSHQTATRRSDSEPIFSYNPLKDGPGIRRKDPLASTWDKNTFIEPLRPPGARNINSTTWGEIDARLNKRDVDAFIAQPHTRPGVNEPWSVDNARGWWKPTEREFDQSHRIVPSVTSEHRATPGGEFLPQPVENTRMLGVIDRAGSLGKTDRLRMDALVEHLQQGGTLSSKDREFVEGLTEINHGSMPMEVLEENQFVVKQISDQNQAKLYSKQLIQAIAQSKKTGEEVGRVPFSNANVQSVLNGLSRSDPAHRTLINLWYKYWAHGGKALD